MNTDEDLDETRRGRAMTTRVCPGCGMQHACEEPLSAGHVGRRIAWTDYEKIGRSRRERAVERVGTVTDVVAGRSRGAPDERLVVACDDGVERSIEDWRFLQNIGTLRVVATEQIGR